MHPVILAPTTIGETPPLEYIETAARAGYDGIGLRLYPSPGMTFFPVVGDSALEQQVRQAVSDTGVKVYEIFTCYLQPDMDFEAMKRAHEYGASLGAQYALVIGDDPEWGRLVENFGRLCDNAAQFGLTCALEAPVGRRTLTTLELNLKVIEEAKRDNVGLSIDPAQFMRSGGKAAMLRAVDPKLFHYGQINDTTSMTVGDPLCMPGEGIVPLDEYLDALPPDLMLGLEYHHRDDRYTPLAWATHVLEGTRAYLRRYHESRGLLPPTSSLPAESGTL